MIRISLAWVKRFQSRMQAKKQVEKKNTTGRSYRAPFTPWLRAAAK
jgi:hypothetical protein